MKRCSNRDCTEKHPDFYAYSKRCKACHRAYAFWANHLKRKAGRVAEGA